MNKRLHEVLLAEDDEDDVAMFVEAVRTGPVKVELRVARDGLEAIRLSKDQASSLDLVILDLNLPKATGFDVLYDIRRDSRLDLIPVIIFTNSQTPADALRAYRGGASCFVTKPLGLDGFTETVHCIERFWLSMVTLPPPH